MAVDFSKFDQSVDLEGLKKDIEDVEKNGGSGDFEDVPLGEYEVKITKLEQVLSKKGDPMFTCWFKVLSGQYKDRLIFMNQVITQPFQIHIVKEFLKRLDSDFDVDFESYNQFAQLILDIHENIDGVLEYALEYGETNKGFSTFKIKDVFEVD